LRAALAPAISYHRRRNEALAGFFAVGKVRHLLGGIAALFEDEPGSILIGCISSWRNCPSIPARFCPPKLLLAEKSIKMGLALTASPISMLSRRNLRRRQSGRG